jgi:hypothetical protein
MTEPATAKNDEIIAEEYDLVVLGSGEGSKFVAWTPAKQGQRVAGVERKWIGGSWAHPTLAEGVVVLFSSAGKYGA